MTLLPFVLGPTFVVVLLGGTLFDGDAGHREQLAFRDVFHFYTPLYQYLADRNSGEIIPLWNPLCQTGMPLIGETTTAVLYPIRYAVSSIAWYVTLHLIWASITAALATRWIGCSWRGQTIASLIYPLSGSVYFLHTNPPFLVSASWLPLAMVSLIGTTKLTWPRRIALAAISLAMMVLGGDPQTALHCVLVSAVVLVIPVALFRSQDSRVELATIGCAALLSGLIAAPQIAASLSWSGQSDRVHIVHEEPTWFSPPITGGNKQAAMEYSVAPWHFAELLTPSAWGSLIPVNQRISALIPGDGRMWTPTLFMGMTVVWMILDRTWLCLRRRSTPITRRLARSNRWIAIAAVSGFAAMGHFGLVWWLQSLTGQFDSLDSAALGPYWLLYHGLPGYEAFRYPAKWLPMFALGLTMATAIWVDRRAYRRSAARMLVIAITLAALWSATYFFDQSLVNNAGTISDPYWGPLHVAVGLGEIRLSIALSIVAAVGFSVAAWFKPTRRSMTWAPGILIGITAVQLAWSASQITYVAFRHPIALPPLSADQSLALTPSQPTGDTPISTSPQSNNQKPNSQVSNWAASHTNESPFRWMRVQLNGGWPKTWATSSSTYRLDEVSSAERMSRFGRWHMVDNDAVFNNFVSIGSERQSEFWKAIRELELQYGGTLPDESWRYIRRWLAIDGVIEQSDRGIATTNVDPIQQPIEVVTHWRTLEDREPTAEEIATRIREVIAGNHAGPLVYSDVSDKPASSVSPAHQAAPNNRLERPQFRIISSNEQRLELEVEASATSRLIRPVYQDGHWVASIRDLDLPEAEPERLAIEPTDFLKQSVAVPPGRWNVRFEYRPWWLAPTIAISLMGICVAVGLIFRKPAFAGSR
ncbi:hypothetical protein Pla22_40900 [Rubripirellula amarantea]|uniref:Bacterial membrane protein YfhO n=1 Tax=Rubripirellula amarantea TaxID=2527999 RepID=A0A5C5WMT0_9BACT|nr:hypothetical protein [Rubripirellula amarantea]TWT51313.1 hypothetical protein Pla22_40900 [Rubripirellula amarantea]